MSSTTRVHCTNFMVDIQPNERRIETSGMFYICRLIKIFELKFCYKRRTLSKLKNSQNLAADQKKSYYTELEEFSKVWVFAVNRVRKEVKKMGTRNLFK